MHLVYILKNRNENQSKQLNWLKNRIFSQFDFLSGNPETILVDIAIQPQLSQGALMLLNYCSCRTIQSFFLFVFLFFFVVGGQTPRDSLNQEYYRQKKLKAVSGPAEGELSGSVVITDKLIIEKEKSLLILPGTDINLTKGAQIIVKGSLIGFGNWKSQISILPLRREDYPTPPAKEMPLNWDFISVAADARLELKFTRLSGSRMGIIVDSAVEFVGLDTIWFNNNEIGNVTVNDEEIEIKDDGFLAHYQYNSTVTLEKRNNYGLLPKIIPPMQKHQPGASLTSTILSCVVLSIGGVLRLYSEDRYYDFWAQRRDIAQFESATTENIQKVEELEGKMEKQREGIRNGNILMAIGGVGFAITFPFDGLFGKNGALHRRQNDK